MTLQVKLKHVDDSTPYGYPAKSVEIKTKEGCIITPIRAVTSYEYNQKTLVPSDVVLNDQVSVYFGRYSGQRLEGFLNNDRPFESLSNHLRIHKERSYSHLNIALLKPIFNKVKYNDKSIEKFFRLTIQAQILHRFDPISVSIPKIPLTKAKKIMVDINKTVERQNTSCIFFLEMGREFPELLNYATNILGQQLVGVYHKRFDRAIQSYEAIRTYHDKDVAFVVANATRYDTRYDDISTMHYMPFLSNDIFTSQVPTPPIVKPDKPLPDNKARLSGLRLFDRNRLTLDPILNQPNNVDQLLDEIGRTNDHSLRNMLDNWQDAGEPGDDLKLRRLSAFTKIHEAKVSSLEFVKYAKRIRNREIKHYVDEPNKTNLKSVVKAIRSK